MEGACRHLAKSTKLIPELQIVRADAELLLSEIIDLAQDRHTLLHAMWEEFPPDDATQMAVLLIKHTKKSANGLDFARADVALSKLNEILKRINDASKRLYPLAQIIAALEPIPQVDWPI